MDSNTPLLASASFTATPGSRALALAIEETFQEMQYRKLIRRLRGTYEDDKPWTMFWVGLTILLVFGMVAPSFAHGNITVHVNFQDLGFYSLSVLIVTGLLVYTLTRVMVVVRWALYWMLLAEALFYFLEGKVNMFATPSKVPWLQWGLIVVEALTFVIYIIVHFIYPRILRSQFFRSAIGAKFWFGVKPILSGPDTSPFVRVLSLSYFNGPRLYTSRSTCTFRGAVDEFGLPHGVGRWMDDGKHGEILSGVWHHGQPVGPFRSREFGSGFGFANLRIGYLHFSDDSMTSRNWFPTWNEPPKIGVASVECSVTGQFFSHLPEVNNLYGPFILDSKSSDANATEEQTISSMETDGISPLRTPGQSREASEASEINPHGSIRFPPVDEMLRASVAYCFARMPHLSTEHPSASLLVSADSARGVTISGHVPINRVFDATQPIVIDVVRGGVVESSFGVPISRRVAPGNEVGIQKQSRHKKGEMSNVEGGSVVPFSISSPRPIRASATSTAGGIGGAFSVDVPLITPEPDAGMRVSVALPELELERSKSRNAASKEGASNIASIGSNGWGGAGGGRLTPRAIRSRRAFSTASSASKGACKSCREEGKVGSVGRSTDADDEEEDDEDEDENMSGYDWKGSYEGPGVLGRVGPPLVGDNAGQSSFLFHYGSTLASSISSSTIEQPSAFHFQQPRVNEFMIHGDNNDTNDTTNRNGHIVRGGLCNGYIAEQEQEVIVDGLVSAVGSGDELQRSGSSDNDDLPVPNPLGPQPTLPPLRRQPISIQHGGGITAGNSAPHLRVRGWLGSQDGHAEALIFFAGYNSSTANSLGRLGQLLAIGHFPPHIKPFVFRWPCARELTYMHALKSSESPKTIRALRMLLEGIRASGITDVHFLAHSLGALTLMNAFEDSWFKSAEDAGAVAADANGGRDSGIAEMFEAMIPPEEDQEPTDTSPIRPGRGDEGAQGGSSGGVTLMRARTVTFLNPDYPLSWFLNGGFASIRRVCNHITVIGDRKDGALFWSEFANGIIHTAYHKGWVPKFAQREHYLKDQRYNHVARAAAPRGSHHGVDHVMQRQPSLGRNIFSIFVHSTSTRGGPSDIIAGDEGENGEAARADKPRRQQGQQLRMPHVPKQHWLDVDVIDTTWMDHNVHALRHSYFNLNPVLVEDLHDIIVTGKRAAERSLLLHREGNIFSYCSAPQCVVNT